ncbi:MAG: chemotaxis protein CheW, partial [Bacteriovorax sp.]|nr:chemotaxis protein CheW [Bacteriovorax sp.]
EESHPMLLEIEDLIMSLESNPDNANLLNTYFRLLHTIKGTASCVGLKNIPKFTHKYEDLVVKLQNRQITLTGGVADALLKGLDQLKFMYAQVKLGNLEVNIDEALCIFDTDKIIHNTENKYKNDIAPSKKPIVESVDATEDKIGVSINILDNFMELSGQFTVLRNTLTKSAMVLEQRYHGDNEIELVIDSLEELHKVSSILQNDIAEMRKVSLEVVYKPLRRVVRDSSKILNKNIEFHVEGEGLRVDTSIGKVLSNSLVHMIRNSIDHGIELPEKRIGAGKSNTGTIRLKSFQDGENIIVELSDDGNGLSLSRIKQKAIEKNLFSEEQLKKMSDQRIFAIIFDSGFSTAQQVSDISGRGVGMDMVRSSIDSVGGKIVIDSKEGIGTTFTLTLPIPRSVLIIKSLMIRSGDSIYSIPLDEVAEVVRLEDYADSKILHSIERSLILSHHDELLPLVDLNQVLYKKGHNDQFDIMNIVIVRGDGYKYGIIVDEIMDIEEIVVKKMSPHLKNAKCFMGITFIGHGALALILNLLSIAEMSHIKCGEIETNDLDIANISHADEMEFMQFNLNKSHNYAFPLQVVNRLEEIATSEIEFCGSIPLVRYRDEPMPLLFIERQLKLCAVSDSLTEFYPEILNVIVVNLRNKRFGIVVDEILDIGTTSELLDTQNIDRVGFIGTVLIDNKTVTILDIHFLVDNYLKFEMELSDQEFSKLSEKSYWHEDEAA